MKEPKKNTKEEAIKKCDNNHAFIVNGIECRIVLYLQSLNCFSVVYDCYTYKYSDIINSYTIINDREKYKLLKQYFNNCDEVEIIERSTNKKGVYKFSLDEFSRYGIVKFIYGIDILNYNHKIKEHTKYLNDCYKKYKNLDFNDYVLLSKDNSVRTSHELESDRTQKRDLKEFQILDNKYFNHLINKFQNKNYGIIREFEGSNLAHIYNNCKIVEYNTDTKKILFEFFRNMNEISIHIDLNINPVKEFLKFTRKCKVNKILG